MSTALHVTKVCAQSVEKLIDSLNSAIANLDNATATIVADHNMAGAPKPPLPVHTFDLFDRFWLAVVVAAAVVVLVLYLYERFGGSKAAVLACSNAAAKVESAVATATKPLPTTVAQAKASGFVGRVEVAVEDVKADVAKVL